MMYRQVDGVAMGSPLGPILANIFLGHCESRIPVEQWPDLYCRFVDDTFSLFSGGNPEALKFLNTLNGLHPSLVFTMESEEDNKLSFLDVLVIREEKEFSSTIYRKPTFTGLYNRWDSYSAYDQKVALIRSLTLRAKRICSPQHLNDEVAGVPLRPILSMVNAPQHELAKWLASVLHPVLMKYNVHAVKDTFEFCANLEACASDRNISGSFMCSFDVSVYTNIPLQETLQICLDTLYRDNDVAKPSMPEKLLKTLLLKATTQVDFSFGEVMYRQVDGVAMGSPLGPVLANIFMGYCESKVPEDSWPWFYNRFVDDTFSLFESESVSHMFFCAVKRTGPGAAVYR